MDVGEWVVMPQVFISSRVRPQPEPVCGGNCVAADVGKVDVMGVWDMNGGLEKTMEGIPVVKAFCWACAWVDVC